MTFEPGWSRLIVWVDAMSDDATPCPRSGTTVPCGGWIVARVSTVEAIMHRAFGEVVAGPRRHAGGSHGEHAFGVASP